MHADGVPHTIKKLLTMAIIFFQTSLQSKVCTQSYWPPKLWESQFWEFWDSHLGVSWPGTEYIIRGNVVASLKSGRGESCEFMFACGSSMHQKCFNYVLTNLFGLCRSMWVIELLVTFPNPHFRTPECPSIPKVLWAKECAPTPYPSIVFTFKLAVESTKEFGGVSIHGKRSICFLSLAISRLLFIFGRIFELQRALNIIFY